MNKHIKTEAEKLSFSENPYEEYKKILEKVYIENGNYSKILSENGNCKEAESEAVNIFMTNKNIQSKKIAIKMIDDSFNKILSNMSIEELHEVYFKKSGIRL
jgi:hypothetical protein